MNNNIVSSFLSLKNTNLSYDIMHDIINNINKKNKAVLHWKSIENKIFFLINKEKLTDFAHSIHKMGYNAHIIAREFHSLGEIDMGVKIHKVGEYYHIIGENILKNITIMNNRWLTIISKGI